MSNKYNEIKRFSAFNASRQAGFKDGSLIKALNWIYADIEEQSKHGKYYTKYKSLDYSLINRVYQDLLYQNYKLKLGKINQFEYQLDISWDNIDSTYNVKYLLPLEGSDDGEDTTYATVMESGIWDTIRLPNDMDKDYLVGAVGVTGQQLESDEVPEWVKFLEPIEVGSEHD